MSFLERLRQKSDHQKKIIALSVAISVTVIIAIVWIVARAAMQS